MKYFINADDKYLSTVEPTKMTLSFGEACQSDYVFNHKKSEISVSGKESFVLKNTNITGKHNFINLAVASILAIESGLSTIDAVIKAAKNYIPSQNRSQWLERCGKKIFLDAYNANPTSMKMAISAFKDQIEVSEAMLLIGTMNELGRNSAAYHREVATFIKELGFNKVCFFGEMADSYRDGFGGDALCFNSAKDFLKRFSLQEIESKYLFIKGSRSLQLESIVDIK